MHLSGIDGSLYLYRINAAAPEGTPQRRISQEIFLNLVTCRAPEGPEAGAPPFLPESERLEEISPVLHHYIDIFPECLQVLLVPDFHLEDAKDDGTGNRVLVPPFVMELVFSFTCFGVTGKSMRESHEFRMTGISRKGNSW
jgi:hypothetical protein